MFHGLQWSALGVQWPVWPIGLHWIKSGLCFLSLCAPLYCINKAPVLALSIRVYNCNPCSSSSPLGIGLYRVKWYNIYLTSLTYLFGIQYIVKLGHLGITKLQNLNAKYGIGVTNKPCGCFLQTIVIQLVVSSHKCIEFWFFYRMKGFQEQK